MALRALRKRLTSARVQGFNWRLARQGVELGTDAVVQPGVTVGRGAVVAAGAVVTADVAPYAIVVGVPGKEIRKRFPDAVIAELERLNWWEWPEEKMRAHRELFELDLESPGAVDAIRRVQPS
jgi:hypothetical protein